ncbi:hypothetical protein ACNOYE_16915 [Nannocystaceae bacterium ST9]
MIALRCGVLVGGLALAACVDESVSAEPESLVVEADDHAQSKARLAEFEASQRAAIELERRPPSDHRFGSDPVRLIALAPGLGAARFAGLLRGGDRLLVLDEFGATLAELPTPHLPTGLALAPDRTTLVVVGIGEPVVQIAALSIDESGALGLREQARVGLGPDALAPRDLTFAGGRLWIVDEGRAAIHSIAWPPSETPRVGTHPHCRGPIEVRAIGEHLLTNCLLDHALRIDALAPDSDAPREQARIVHDGPIWAFDGRVEPDGSLRLALAGVEDHPLDRRDGGFGYVDSFVFLARFDPATRTSVREAEIDVSELGVVTPKAIAFAPTRAGEDWALDLTGYATAERLRLHGRGASVSEVERHPWLPGTQSLLRIEDEAGGATTWLAANPLLDVWMLVAGDSPPGWVALPDERDDRSFEERLGEALVYTTAMAPDNSSEGLRSRFTCETCHFEGRGDGRTHWTGRGEVHATSKTLFGLFENRPHFSRALDRTMAVMVDNEFHVANRHGPRDPWAPLSERDLAWLAMLQGWPGEVDGERLRRSLMAFLIRWTLPSNPRARARAGQAFTAREARGAELFREHCESCHEARLLADDPDTRVPFDRWAELVLSESGPIVWASDVYAGTAIRPWVHELGARVPSLRRLHLDGPYFTTGQADSVSAVLEGVRIRPDHELRVDHDLPGSPGQALSREQQLDLLAFLDLL